MQIHHPYRNRPIPYWPLVWLLLAGLALRVFRLGDKNVWWDEGLASWAARQSATAIAHWTATDVHPPLYFWLLHLWRPFSGDSEFGLRLLSAFFGVLTIAATYLLGKQINGRTTGLLAAFFITFSRFAIGWSQEMRMYALAALLGALALWAAVAVWERGRRRDWLFYVAFMTAGLYTLYLFVMVLVTANLVWLFLFLPRQQKRWRAFWQWSLAQTAVLLLYAPWLAYALGRIPTWSQANFVEPWSFLKIYWTVLTVGIPLDVDRYAAYTLPLFLLFLAGIFLIAVQRRQPASRRHLVLLITGLLLPALVVYIVALPKANFFYSPPLDPRYLITFLSAYAVLLAWGLTVIGARQPGADGSPSFGLAAATAPGRPAPRANRRYREWGLGLIGAGFVGYVALFGLSGYHRSRVLVDDFASLTATLQAYERPSDAIILYSDNDWPIFAHYYAGEWRGVPGAWQMTPEQAADFLTPIWEESEGVWLVVTQYAAIGDPQQWLVQWLAERAQAQASFTYGDKQLLFFARTPERTALRDALQPDAAPPTLLNNDLGNGRILTGYDLQTQDFRSGDVLHLFLYWQGDGAAAYRLGVSGADGRYPLLTITAGTARQQVDVLLNSDLPSGRYQFYLADDGDPERPLLTFGQFNLAQKQIAFIRPEDVTVQNRTDAAFQQGIILSGYDLATTRFQPGEAIPLTLYWQSAGDIGQRYKVFTHIIGDVYNINSDNFLWGQQDNEPQNGRRPTTTWRAGELIVDSYAIPLDAQAPPGVYQIEVGLYDPLTGQRLLLSDGRDHLILTMVQVDGP
jgi:4-amino-4-deoxy-L-arabinose transferase-like glycosyltransferase